MGRSAKDDVFELEHWLRVGKRDPLTSQHHAAELWPRAAST